MRAHDELIGRGWAFPLGTAPNGGIAMSSGSDDIEQSIRLILATAIGERPMRPEFGSRIHEFVFAPINDATMTDLAYEVRQAIDRWEKRVIVVDVMVSAANAASGHLLIEIVYEITATYDRLNLVFPFYVIPDHD